MSRPQFITEHIYTGTGATASYSFTFKITRPEQLLMIIRDTSGDELKRFRGDNNVEVSSLSFDRFNGGGTVILPVNLASGYVFGIFLDDAEPIQDYEFRKKTSFDMRRFEDAMDNLGAGIQTLMRRMKKVITLGEFDDETVFNTNFPVTDSTEKRVITIDQDGIHVGPELSNVGGGGTTPDADAVEGDYITFEDDSGDIVPVYESGVFQGYSARFSENISVGTLREALLAIFNFTYLGPLVSLSSSPAQSVREKGTNVASASLTANTTKRSEDIVEVRFYRGATLIYTDTTPSADGSVDSTYTDNTPFTDNVSYSAQVEDVLGGISSSNTVSYPFVYPYYHGAGAPALTAAAVAGLTKSVISSTASLNRTFTTSNGDVYYFAYPASYGALTSIKDENNFETFGDWTLRTENITGLDGNPVSYRIYEFNNPVVAGSTNYTFVR